MWICVKLVFLGILGLIVISFFNINSFGEVFQSDEDNFQIIIPESFSISKSDSSYILKDSNETTRIQIFKATWLSDFDSVNVDTLSEIPSTWFCIYDGYCYVSPTESTELISNGGFNYGFLREVGVIQNSKVAIDYIIRTSLIPINGEWWQTITIWDNPMHYDWTISEVIKIESSFHSIPSKNIVETSTTDGISITDGTQSNSKKIIPSLDFINYEINIAVNFIKNNLTNFLKSEIIILFIVISIIIVSYFIYRYIKNYKKSSLIKNKLLFKETFVVKSPNKNTITIGVDYSNTRLNSTWITGGTHVIKDGAMYGEYFMYFSQTSKNNEIRQLFESSLPLDGWTRKGEKYSMLTIASTEFEAGLFFKKTCSFFEHQLKKNNFLNIS
jgi:hypothetical protein